MRDANRKSTPPQSGPALGRRSLLAGIAAIGAGTQPALGQNGFPNGPVKLVVPYPPGGGTDIVARLIAEPMSADLGKPVIVDNRAGAGGNLGAEQVARAAPDGLTLLVTAGALAIAPSVQRSLSLNPTRDLTGVALLALVPLLIVVRPDSPLRSIADLLALVRSKSGKVNYGSFGVATPPHLVGERIGQEVGMRMNHVPYRGGAQAIPDILSGALDFAILDAVSMTPNVLSGRLRALAITGPQRSPALPQLHTLSEEGVAFDTVGWHAAFAPARTPASIVARLNAAFVRAVALPDIRNAIVNAGALPIDPPLDPAAWTARFKQDVEAWGTVARASKIEVE